MGEICKASQHMPPHVCSQDGSGELLLNTSIESGDTVVIVDKRALCFCPCKSTPRQTSVVAGSASVRWVFKPQESEKCLELQMKILAAAQPQPK